jgi:O-antigen ligase
MNQFRANMLQLLVFGLLGGVVVMSGERKSLIIYVFAALILMSGIGPRKSLQILIAPVAVMAITLIFFADDYTMRHIDSLTLTTEYDLEGVPTSFSNQQRAFALETGWNMLQESPFIGIGTNAYDKTIERAFANYPSYFLKGIHSEFFRILVENGFIGFIAYVSIWIASAIRTWNLAKRLRATGLMSSLQAKSYLRVYAMLFVTSGIICGLEASGTDLFLLLALVSLWPDLSKTVILQRTARVRQPVPSIEMGGA